MRKGLSRKWRIRMDMLTDMYEDGFELATELLMVVLGYVLLLPVYFLFWVIDRIEGGDEK